MGRAINYGRVLCILFPVFLSLINNARSYGQASFTMPDTVCVNAPVNITNTSGSASTYNWNFCQPDLTATPTAVSMGNIGNTLNIPAYIDYGLENGTYYGLLVNNGPSGGLIRLNFGNSLLNTPTATSLGTFSGNIASAAQGIQLVNDNNRWYAIIVGGDPSAGTTPRILKADFGTSLTNTPVITNWGNIGNIQYPHDIYVFNENNNWYGLVVNYVSSAITRFNFGPTFNSSAVPTAITFTNAGNNLGLNGPTGFYPFNDNGVWRVFVTNYTNHTLTRLDFGSSLLNTSPTAVSLGNPGGALKNPRDLIVMSDCSQAVAFVGNTNGDIIKLNFSTASATSPLASNLGTLGGGGNIQSFSKMFKVGVDTYLFEPNSISNNFSRIRFAGCNSASIPNSTSKTPPTVSYGTPGTYTVSLVIDEGLSTQASLCKQIVVVAPTKSGSVTPSAVTVCEGSVISITASGGDQYEWIVKTGVTNPAAPSNTIMAAANIQYAIKVTKTICGISDTVYSTVTVNPLPRPVVTKSNDIDCGNGSAQLTASGGAQYVWSPATGLSDNLIANPVAQPAQTTTYLVNVTSSKGCSVSDSITVAVNLSAPSTNPYSMPTAFTPNKDGLNDCFGITKWGTIKSVEFSIFNRWGERVFYTTNPSKCWDGTVGGIQQASGTYIYLIQADVSCAVIQRKGTFLLIR